MFALPPTQLATLHRRVGIGARDQTKNDHHLAGN
jgi:hypothetical protein